MKRTLQLLFAALVLILAVPSFAQDREKKAASKVVKHDVKSVKKASIVPGKAADVTYDGKKFKTLKLTLGDDTQLAYKLLRGSEVVSSGHTTGVIEVKSDGKSTYTLQLTNPTKKAVNAVVVAAGGGSGI